MIVCGRGDTVQHSDRSPASQSFARSVLKLAGASPRSHPILYSFFGEEQKRELSTWMVHDLTREPRFG